MMKEYALNSPTDTINVKQHLMKCAMKVELCDEETFL